MNEDAAKEAAVARMLATASDEDLLEIIRAVCGEIPPEFRGPGRQAAIAEWRDAWREESREWREGLS